MDNHRNIAFTYARIVERLQIISNCALCLKQKQIYGVRHVKSCNAIVVVFVYTYILKSDILKVLAQLKDVSKRDTLMSYSNSLAGFNGNLRLKVIKNILLNI